MKINVHEGKGDDGRVVAAKLATLLDRAGLPRSSAWKTAQPVVFCADWQGRNADPQRQTEVRLLWSPACLFLRFRARFRVIYVYEGGNSRRDQLWLRDVAEVFIRRGLDDPRHYREFEISPNGDWLDLDISQGRKSDLMCDLKTRVDIDEKSKVWIAEFALPFSCLTPVFDPDETWRVNFFRVEGAEPNRFYSSWHATHTPQPNFHVPEVFGELRFSTK